MGTETNVTGKSSGVGIVIFILFGIILFFSVLWQLPKFSIPRSVHDPATRQEIEDRSRQTLAQILGGGFFVVTAFFTWKQVKAAEENVRIARGNFNLAGVTAEENRKQQQRHFDEKQKADQDRFDRQVLNAEFSDILDRFSDNDNAIMRANAANRLSDMGSRQLPGMIAEPASEAYPFFRRASAQLTAALHMEEAQQVRDEISKALKRLAEFSVTVNQSLLHIEINDLIDANKSALYNFIQTFAEYKIQLEEDDVASVDDESYLDTLANYTRFCESYYHLSQPEAIEQVLLKDMLASQQGQQALVIRGAIRSAQEVSVRNTPENILKELWLGSIRLKETRNALNYCLYRLSAPTDIPKDLIELTEWVRSPVLALNGCFLAGANFSQTQLQGAQIVGAYLHNVYADSADFRKSNFDSSIMKNVEFTVVDLRCARLGFVDMQGAELLSVRLDGAYLRLSDNVEFSSINFTGSNYNAMIPVTWKSPRGKALKDHLKENYPDQDNGA